MQDFGIKIKEMEMVSGNIAAIEDTRNSNVHALYDFMSATKSHNGVYDVVYVDITWRL